MKEGEEEREDEKMKGGEAGGKEGEEDAEDDKC